MCVWANSKLYHWSNNVPPTPSTKVLNDLLKIANMLFSIWPFLAFLIFFSTLHGDSEIRTHSLAISSRSSS